MKKNFTLIELIVVIAIISILAAIVVPNISNMKGKADRTALDSNLRNLQTASDMYLLEQEDYPGISKPTEFAPKPVDFAKLYPEHLRNLPKTKNIKYWVDFTGTIWGSSVDVPKNFTATSTEISWEQNPEAIGYQIYQLEKTTTTGSVQSKFQLKKIEQLGADQTSYAITSGKTYLVSSLDKNGFLTAPIGEKVDEYVDTLESIRNGHSGETVTPPEEPVVPIVPEELGEGLNNTFAMLTSGIVRGWGNNTLRQIDRDTWSTGNLTAPTLVPSSTNIKYIGSGFQFTLALLNDGTVMGWGVNSRGQLGDNTTTTPMNFSTVMTQISNVKQIALGNEHALALLNNGKVMAWGRNAEGQIGNGTTTDQLVPIEILSDVKQIAAKENFSMALLSNGKVMTWGSNASGQIGNNSTVNQLVPVEVQGIANATDIAAGKNHTLAVLSNGKVMTWGANTYGQLGNGNGTNQLIPVEVQGISNATQVSGGAEFSTALLKTGKVMTWGRNNEGQLGNGSNTDSNIPTEVQNLTNVQKITTGDAHALVITSESKFMTWGRNTAGQLGDGTKVSKNSPVQIIMP